MNISLPPAMAEFVRRRVARHYRNVSEFFGELVREKIQHEIDADLAFLESTNQRAPPGPTEADIKQILALQKKVRKKRHARSL